jgi:outer membrane protein OmpA-like peptidoglycan-associated protein
MKKILLSFLTIGLFVCAFGQSEWKKRPALGIHLTLTDFKTAADIRANGLSSVVRSKLYHKTSRMTAGLAVSYLEGLGDHIDFVGSLNCTFVDYPIPNVSSFNTNNPLLELVATANLKMFTDKAFINPFLTAGVGASKYKGYYGAFIPIGVGLQFRIFDDAFLIWNSQYRAQVTENTNYHFYHAFGVAANIRKKKEKVIEVPVIPVVVIDYDKDKDGVPDSTDRCPDVFGLASLKGCPDRDGDGIADIDDKCPDVPGLARYQGCPIPDRDKDGINDEEDKCPDVFGYARYQGCPIPDRDKDGVNDEEDKCPDVPGPASNYGCPLIPETVISKFNTLAKQVFFATGSYKLLPKSYGPLKQVATILRDNPDFRLTVEGHTDSTGKYDMNMQLSRDRAASVVTYLTTKEGVDAGRLTSEGYGPDRPIAPNKTTAGRARNRRVEMKVRNYQ